MDDLHWVIYTGWLTLGDWQAILTPGSLNEQIWNIGSFWLDLFLTNFHIPLPLLSTFGGCWVFVSPFNDYHKFKILQSLLLFLNFVPVPAPWRKVLRPLPWILESPILKVGEQRTTSVLWLLKNRLSAVKALHTGVRWSIFTHYWNTPP